MPSARKITSAGTPKRPESGLARPASASRMPIAARRVAVAIGSVTRQQVRQLGQIAQHEVRRRTVVRLERRARIPHASRDPRRAHAEPRRADHVGAQAVADVQRLLGRDAQTPRAPPRRSRAAACAAPARPRSRRRRDGARARLRRGCCSAVCECEKFEHSPILRARRARRAARSWCAGTRTCSRNKPMCTDVSRPGSSGSATPRRVRRGREALLASRPRDPRRSATRGTRVDPPAERIGEGVERERVPRAGRLVQGGQARRQPPAATSACGRLS